MYDLLLKWGLDSLSKATLSKSDQELSVMLEAIRAKNALVAERFRFSWNTSQSIIGIALEVEEAQESLKAAIRDYDWKSKTGRNKILFQLQEFHAPYTRKLKKIRCSFDATNDLLSAYSAVFDDLLHLDRLVEFAEARELTKRSDVLWLYRGLWQFYSRVMSALVRVTSSDLRFWLTDEPYVSVAFTWAEKDLNAARDWLSLPVGHGERFFLSLETPGGLSDFWCFVESELNE